MATFTLEELKNKHGDAPAKRVFSLEELKAKQDMGSKMKVARIENKEGVLGKTAGVLGLRKEDPMNRVKDVPSDIMEGVGNIADRFKARTERVRGNIERRAEDGTDNLEKAGTVLDVVGGAFGTAADVFGEGVMTAAKLALTPEQEEMIGGFVEEQAGKAVNTKFVKDVVAGWNDFEAENPEAASNIRAGGDFLLFLTEALGLKGGGAAAKRTADVAAKVIEKSSPIVRGAGDIVGAGVKKVEDVAGDIGVARQAENAAKADAQIDEITGRIIQGKPKDVESARRALSDLDTTGVKTYKELNTRINDQVGALSRKLDGFLDEQPGVLKSDDLVTTTKVGDRVVKQNFVETSLKQLDELYEKIGDGVAQAKIQNIQEKLAVEGLTRRELNDLSREYGRELGNKGFSKVSGEPLTSVNAQAFENTRKGIKTTVRNSIEGDVAKSLDSSISDLLDTSRLTSKIEVSVNSLFQKVQKRGLMEKLSRKLADVINLTTFNTIPGFIGRFLPSNVGLKTMNNLDIEAELLKNLKKLDALGETVSDDQLIKGIEAIIRSEPLPKAKGAAAPKTAGIAEVRNPVDMDTLKVSAKERGYDFNKLSDEVDKRLADAPEAKKYIDDITENIVKDIPNTKPAIAPIKSKERILEKTILEEGGDINNIRDIARNTIVPFDDAARSKVIATMDARKDIFQKKVQTADKYMGYEGVLYNIKTPSGLISEIQVVTPKMTFGKNQPDASRGILGDELFDKIAKETGLEPGLGHKLYEDFRGMSIADKEGSPGLRLIEQSVDYYSKLR